MAVLVKENVREQLKSLGGWKRFIGTLLGFLNLPSLNLGPPKVRKLAQDKHHGGIGGSMYCVFAVCIGLRVPALVYHLLLCELHNLSQPSPIFDS